MDLDLTERGNNAFRSEEGNTVLFAEIGPDCAYLQVAFNPMNYPAWDVSTVKLHDDDLINHIMYNLDGWHIDKCQFVEVNSVDGYVIGAVTVIDDIINDIMDRAVEHDYDPMKNVGTGIEDITDSAATLGYTLTQRMSQECYEELIERFDNS